ncbi:receptor-like protein EIX1 [Gossypium hirsutum]|uniref:Receptor-like protein EIX1 n=1 Tax=Gossypium hirsutum TaxID=3635 RepID=A0A1U8LRU9_GOSHI|nr:receptor-like protein EIX1 [Gossypium hirsutum]
MAKTLALISWWKSNRPIGCSNNCCIWRGISCDETNGHVVKLNLRAPWASLLREERKSLVASVLNSCLLQFTYLEHLDLSGNNFQYSPIPQIFGSMKQLRYLNISNSRFNDQGPPWALTVHDVQWISNLSSLQHLGMAGICLGETPSLFQVLNRFPSFLSLHLSQCGLNNSHLSWHPINSSFHGVRHLDLGQNDFPGTVPSMIQNMTSLRFLDLSFNLFITSSIHNSFGNFKNLLHLNIVANAFSGIEKALLLMFGNMCYLRSLDISYNQLPGEQIGKYRNLSRCFGHDLEALNLDYARISGYVPNWLGMLGNLKHVHLSHNQLNGTVPESLGQLSNLETLDLSYDSLEAAICEVHFASLSKLKTLSIGSTGLTIKIKSDWIPPFQLEYIEMESCKFGTQIPQWLQTQSKATTLLLSNASIWGTLPKWMKDMNLNELDLTHSQIKGTLPRFPSNLKLIDLSGNSISGVPPGKDGCSSHAMGHLCWLTWLDLSNNKLSGQLSLALKNCTSLRFLDVGENALSGNVPKWIGDTFGYLRILRLRGNKFNGSIPWQLCQLSTDLRSWILLKTIYKEGYLVALTT